MGDPTGESDDAMADLQGPGGEALARGVLEENTKLLQQLREAVQQLDNPDGQPSEELVSDIAQVVVAANALLHGTSWDESAKAAYAEWQAVEAERVDRDALVEAAGQVRRAAEDMVEAAGTRATEEPTARLQDWTEGERHLQAVVQQASEGCAGLGPVAEG